MVSREWVVNKKFRSLLNVFGDGFGSFRDGMSGEFSGQDEFDCGLNFA